MLNQVFRLLRNPQQKASNFGLLESVELGNNLWGPENLMGLLAIFAEAIVVELTGHGVFPPTPGESENDILTLTDLSELTIHHQTPSSDEKSV
jgi:hypothetical protein